MCLLVWNLAYASFLFKDNEMLYTKNKVDSRPEKQTEQTTYSKKKSQWCCADLESIEFLLEEDSLCVHVGQCGGNATQDEPKYQLPCHHYCNGVDHLLHIGG